MKHCTRISLLTLLAFALAACQQSDSSSNASLESLESRVNYALGYNYASQLLNSGIDLDAQAFAAGVQDAANAAQPRMTNEQMQAAFEEYQAVLESEMMAEMEGIANENQAAADAFLAQNSAAEGVTTTASGLQYKILEEGSGEIPGENSTVRVHYEGRLLDGTVFDSSYRRGEPVEFGVTQVIPGWTETLLMMPQGSKWQIFIPPYLGYGASGAGGLIGPNQLLIFDVELLEANVSQ